MEVLSKTWKVSLQQQQRTHQQKLEVSWSVWMQLIHQAGCGPRYSTIFHDVNGKIRNLWRKTAEHLPLFCGKPAGDGRSTIFVPLRGLSLKKKGGLLSFLGF